MSLAECGARCGARPHCLGYNYQRAARSCALLTQPARFVPQPGHVAARKCTSCQLREWTKVIKFMIIFIYLNIIHKLISPSIDMHYITFYTCRQLGQLQKLLMTSVLKPAAASAILSLHVHISIISTAKYCLTPGLNAFSYTAKEEQTSHLLMETLSSGEDPTVPTRYLTLTLVLQWAAVPRPGGCGPLRPQPDGGHPGGGHQRGGGQPGHTQGLECSNFDIIIFGKLLLLLTAYVFTYLCLFSLSLSTGI